MHFRNDPHDGSVSSTDNHYDSSPSVGGLFQFSEGSCPFGDEVEEVDIDEFRLRLLSKGNVEFHFLDLSEAGVLPERGSCCLLLLPMSCSLAGR